MDILQAIQDFMTPLPVWDSRGEILMPPFCGAHLIWLAMSLAVGILLVRTHMKLARAPEARRRFEVAVAIAPLAFYGIHTSSMLAWGAFNPNCLPIHLCNLCEVLALVYAISGSGLVGNVLYGAGIVGSLAALLFPGWTTAPAWSLPSVCGFMEHTLVLAFIAMKLADRSIRPVRQNVWQPLAFTGLYLCAIYPLNKLLGTNYAFVNWAPYGTPLILWEQAWGNPGYIAPYALVFVLLELALFWFWKPGAGQEENV